MKKLTEKEKEELLFNLSQRLSDFQINALVAEYVFGWTKIHIEEIGLEKKVSGLPWVYNFINEKHAWLPRRVVPDSIGADFHDMEFFVSHFCGINLSWDGVAWTVELSPFEGNSGDVVRVWDASLNYTFAKAAILASAGIWNVQMGLSGYVLDTKEINVS